MFSDEMSMPVMLQSMGKVFTGMNLSDEQAHALAPMLQTFMAEINLLQEIDTLALEPVLPPTWKEGRFGL